MDWRRNTIWQRIYRNSVYQAVIDIVQVIPTNVLIDLELKAKARIITRDINDWPAVAAALLLECPVWTEDKDFFGSGIATWTTATIELYLSDQ